MTHEALQAGDGQSREVPVTDEACLATKYHLKLEFSSFSAGKNSLANKSNAAIVLRRRG